MKELSKKQFYIRSLTWGLPVTAAGSVVALAMMATGHKPQKHGWCWYFEAGDRWGRRIKKKLGRPLQGRYDDIWFEGQASELGRHYINDRVGANK